MIRAEQYLLGRAILGDRKALKTVAETLRPLVISYQGRFDRREIDILTKRFGLHTASGRGKTLEEIGAQYHVTRERIRQLEARALLKFKRAFEHIDNQRDRMAEALVVVGKKECSSGHVQAAR
jgi:DNA-directed RNA polymerase sigma subunit (sigma70/sigma32)